MRLIDNKRKGARERGSEGGMGRSSERPRAGASLAGGTKLAVPTLALLCLASFFLGSLYGGSSSQSLPSLKRKVKTTRSTAVDSDLATVTTTTTAAALRDGEGRKMLEVPEQHQLSQATSSSSSSSTNTDQGGADALLEYPHQVLSWYPRALLFPNFADADTCDKIISLAKKSLRPSALALRKGESANSTKNIRTSTGTFISSRNDNSGALRRVERKMHSIVFLPLSHGEPFNILRYEVGQKYNSHFDPFKPEEYGPTKSQRVASFLLYLSDVEEGGETMFPYEGFRNMDSGYDFVQCLGLKVKPRKGDALLFWSVYPNGTIDQTALHGSCPVIKGEKWVATRWIRNRPL